MSSPVFMFDGEDPEMKRAFENARNTFKFFWRELSWEKRRIIPGLDLVMVKLPFTDGKRTDGSAEFEQMWVNELDFDGISLRGRLLNAPNWLKSVKQGDIITAPFSNLADWMFTENSVAYGGHTVNVMRSKMNPRERRAHDQAWGLDFGDPSRIRVEISREPKSKVGFFSKIFGQKEKEQPAEVDPEAGFREHPMCINMLPRIETQLREDPKIGNAADERGWTLLHTDALAGNLGIVQLLVRHGANIHAKTSEGLEAADLARIIGWSEIASYLSEQAEAEQPIIPS